ncbi:hypothetical protein QAD02_013336 [Eretmocerus hayati]|uniref:Uncharacterized protein n=1 Tax=Eretmocerus hayati TaxID=131215 RepID=A0ACC2P2K1_9HYME|nr:hypothetical protein QAD02_013336 [Eretmocerus hayati]
MKNTFTDFEIDFEIGLTDFDDEFEDNHMTGGARLNNVKNIQSKDSSSTICHEELEQGTKQKVGDLTKKKTMEDLKKKLKRLSNIELEYPRRNLDKVHANKQFIIEFMDFLRSLDKRLMIKFNLLIIDHLEM